MRFWCIWWLGSSSEGLGNGEYQVHSDLEWLYLLGSNLCIKQICLKFICILYEYLVQYHHHHVMPLARISLTLSRHFSLSFIVSGRSWGLHPVSSHSCCMYVLAGHPAFTRPYVGVHRSPSLMSLSLLLQQCPVCLVSLTWIVFVMGGKWAYSWCFEGVLPPGLIQSQHSCVIAV